ADPWPVLESAHGVLHDWYGHHRPDEAVCVPGPGDDAQVVGGLGLALTVRTEVQEGIRTAEGQRRPRAQPAAGALPLRSTAARAVEVDASHEGVPSEVTADGPVRRTRNPARSGDDHSRYAGHASDASIYDPQTRAR